MQHKNTLKKIFGGLLGGCTLLNVVAVAQPPAEPSASAAEEAEREVDSASASEPVIATPANQPFEDYEASEQISEDLSVAFPVDI